MVTVQGRDNTRNRCNSISGSLEPIENWLYSILLDPCADFPSSMTCLNENSPTTLLWTGSIYSIDGSLSTVGLTSGSHTFNVNIDSAVRIFTNSICTINLQNANELQNNSKTYYYGSFQISLTNCARATYLSLEHKTDVVNANRFVYPCTGSSRRLQEISENYLNVTLQTHSTIFNTGRWIKINIPSAVYSIELHLNGLSYDTTHKLMLSNMPYQADVVPNRYNKNEWLRFERYNFEHLPNGMHDCQHIFPTATAYAMIQNVIMIGQRQVCSTFHGLSCTEYDTKYICPFNLYLWIPIEDNNEELSVSVKSSAMDGQNGLYQRFETFETRTIVYEPPSPPSLPSSPPCITRYTVSILLDDSDWTNFVQGLNYSDMCHIQFEILYASALSTHLNQIQSKCASSDIIVHFENFTHASLATSVVHEQIQLCKESNPNIQFFSLNGLQTHNSVSDVYIENTYTQIGYSCASQILAQNVAVSHSYTNTTLNNFNNLHIFIPITSIEVQVFEGLTYGLQTYSQSYQLVNSGNTSATTYTIALSDEALNYLPNNQLVFRCGANHANVSYSGLNSFYTGQLTQNVLSTLSSIYYSPPTSPPLSPSS